MTLEERQRKADEMNEALRFLARSPQREELRRQREEVRQLTLRRQARPNRYAP